MNYTVNDRNNKKVPVEIKGKFKKSVKNDNVKSASSLSNSERTARSDAFTNFKDLQKKPIIARSAERKPFMERKPLDSKLYGGNASRSFDSGRRSYARPDGLTRSSDRARSFDVSKPNDAAGKFSDRRTRPFNSNFAYSGVTGRSFNRASESGVGVEKPFDSKNPAYSGTTRRFETRKPFDRGFHGENGAASRSFARPDSVSYSERFKNRSYEARAPRKSFDESGVAKNNIARENAKKDLLNKTMSGNLFNPLNKILKSEDEGRKIFRTYTPKPTANRFNRGGSFDNRGRGFSGDRNSSFSGDRNSRFGKPGFSRPFNNNAGGFSRPFNNNAGGFSRPFNKPGGFSRPFNNSAGGFSRPFNNSAGGFSRPFSRPGDFSKSKPPFQKSFGAGSFAPKSFPGSENRKFSSAKKKFSRPDFSGDKRTNRFRNDESNMSQARFSHQLLGKINSADDVEMDSSYSYRRSRVMRKARETTVVRNVSIPFEGIEASSLANKMAVKLNILQFKLKELNIVGLIDAQIALAIVEEMGHSGHIEAQEIDIKADVGNMEKYKSRCPIVTIVGHVDHGKTSLLDSLRKSNVASGESGGITQAIGASQVFLKKDKFVTFVDTPGHEAFTSMRIRGVEITDIVVLVIAADDGIKDQTIEAIQHIKSAKVPFIVCYTKIDKGVSNIDKIRQQLLIHEVMVESLGGDILEVEVSAMKNKNLDKLLEVLLLQAEMLELKSDYSCMSSGIVLESKLDKHRGPVATVLIKNGLLKYGSYFVVGNTYGKVRAMILSDGKQIKEATASMPVEIMGFNDVPEPGSSFIEVETEKEAKKAVEYRVDIAQKVKVEKNEVNILDFFNKEENEKLNFIIKSDVSGSLEAIIAAISKIEYEGIDINIVGKGNGAINESDVLLAKTTQSTIVSFKVSVSSANSKLAEQSLVKIKKFSVIYELLDYIKGLAEGILAPDEEEEILGKAVIKEIFVKKKLGTIAGCGVEEGIIKLKSKGRVVRNGKEIYTGDIISLKQRQYDKVEMPANQECGIMISGFSDFHIGDTIESFIVKKIEKSTEE